MGLTSALNTALTGLSAAETQIDVIGNNLANSQTVGFKSSQTVFATQFSQTLSLGGGPTAENGGTNPRQVGLGVQVAAIAANHNQGTIEISSSPSDLAIQGDGFFIVESGGGERLYSRNGIFKLNAQAELVNSSGQRLLGFGVDEVFRLQETSLVPLTIPLGSASVAKATENVTFEGTLTPLGDVSSTAQVIQSAKLGNASIPRPDSTSIDLSTSPLINPASIIATPGAGGTLAAGQYQYRFAFVDSSGNESPPSVPIARNVAALGQVNLSGLPVDTTGNYVGVNIYRTDADGSDFFRLASVPTGGTFVDDGSVALSGVALNDTTLTGNYTYVITYGRAGDPESRPSVAIGPRSVVNGRLVLENLPTPPVPPFGGGFPEYDEIRIYRNLAGDQNNFYFVGSVDPGETFTDNRSDAEIANLSNPANRLLDSDGPTINSNTLLTDVLRRDGSTYQRVFTEGTLSYNGRKGGRAIGESDLRITATTTVQDLMDFITASSGIQTVQIDAQNPIPNSLNTIVGESGLLFPGSSIFNGGIRVTSNTGSLNAVDIDLTSFRLRTNDGTVTVPNLAFGELQEAKGQGATSDFIVYDSLGIPVGVRVTATLESRSDEETVYRWYADSTDNEVSGSNGISVGTGLIKFDGNGNFVTSTNERIAINRQGIPSISPLQFNIDFTKVSGLAEQNAFLAATRQDGSAPGKLNSFVVGDDGKIRGIFSNGITRDLGQVQLARFTNPGGLEARGLNLYAAGINTGLPIMGKPGENGIGSVVGGALELSNTDIGKDLIKLVLASTQYRGNSRVITTSQQLLDELLNLRR
ncbi:MAG TPA: flagellar biosynthesis protein FlgE [Planctomycetaceae bacterium]|nr:flagellar biosynthesis protein FlgE [Planctomycetaceae bacterium]